MTADIRRLDHQLRAELRLGVPTTSPHRYRLKLNTIRQPINLFLKVRNIVTRLSECDGESVGYFMLSQRDFPLDRS